MRANLGLFTQPISFAGLPVVAVPMRAPNGLPLGVQVIAAQGREDLALRVAATLEKQGIALSNVRRPHEHGNRHPQVKAEVEAAFAEYERALVTNDVETLDRLFLNSDKTVRYGGGENLYGYAEIAAFVRAARRSASHARSSAR